MLILAMLLFGTLVGGVARLLLPGRQDLSLSATTVAGLLGAATVGSATAAVTDVGFAAGGTSLVGSVVGAALFVVAAEVVNGRRRARGNHVPVRDLIGAGENDRLEFKSTARRNQHTGERDPRIELAVARTVVGFANTAGGTLLIGVDDDGQPIGLDGDLALVKGGDLDRYELWLHDLLERCIDRPALRGIDVGFEIVSGRTVCRIDVRRSSRPWFLRPHTGEKRTQFHVRVGNSTRELDVDDALEYVAVQWPKGATARLLAGVRRGRRGSDVRRDGAATR